MNENKIWLARVRHVRRHGGKDLVSMRRKAGDRDIQLRGGPIDDCKGYNLLKSVPSRPSVPAGDWLQDTFPIAQRLGVQPYPSKHLRGFEPSGRWLQREKS